MKKLLSLVLVLCMIVTGCICFTSCGSKVSTKDVEKNAQSVLSEAMENTSNNFFGADEKANKIVESALKNGSIEILFESDTLMGDITSIKEVLYANDETKTVVSDTTVKYDGQDLTGRLFFNKDGVMLNSESILGSNKTLAVNIATLSDKFDESALAEMMGLEGESLQTVQAMLIAWENTYKQVFADDLQGKYEELMNEIYSLLNQTVTTAKVENAAGKEVKCVVVTYSLTNATVEALVNKLITEVDSLGVEEAKEVTNELKAAVNEIKETVDLNLTLTLNINQKDSTIVSETVTGTVTSKEDATQSASVNAKLLFSETAITLNASATYQEETVAAEVKVTKEEANGNETYKATANVTYEGETYPLAEVVYTLKNDDTFTLTADLYDMNDKGEKQASYGMTGSLKTEKNSVKVEINSVTMDEVTVTFNLVVTFNEKADMPAQPSNAKDVVTLTEDEWMEISEEFAESKLGKILYGSSSWN